MKIKNILPSNLKAAGTISVAVTVLCSQPSQEASWGNGSMKEDNVFGPTWCPQSIPGQADALWKRKLSWRCLDLKLPFHRFDLAQAEPVIVNVAFWLTGFL